MPPRSFPSVRCGLCFHSLISRVLAPSFRLADLVNPIECTGACLVSENLDGFVDWCTSSRALLPFGAHRSTRNFPISVNLPIYRWKQHKHSSDPTLNFAKRSRRISCLETVGMQFILEGHICNSQIVYLCSICQFRTYHCSIL